MLSARWWTLIVWALAAAGALAWGLKIFVKAPAAPPQTQLADAGGLARGDLSRLLGADAAPEAPAQAPEPVADARFELIGVVSPRSPKSAREGLALIAVDGKPPKAYRVGAVIDGDNVLQSVNARGATLGPRDGAPLVALNLAPPAPAATGVPTPLGMGGGMPGGGLPGLPGARIGQPMQQPMPQLMQRPIQPMPPSMPPLQQTTPQPAPQQPSVAGPTRRLQPPQPESTGLDPNPPPGVIPTQQLDPRQTR